MKRYEIKITGVADMLQNRLSKELIDEIKDIPNAKKEEWEEANYKKKLYTNREGEVIIPDLVLHSFLQESCKKYKVNPPKSIGRTWTAYFKSSVLVLDSPVMENVEVTKFGAMVNGSPSSSKGSSKVYRVRPRISKGWSITVTIMDTAEYLNESTITGIFEAGGMFVGLCDWRPVFGRFKVDSVKEV